MNLEFALRTDTYQGFGRIKYMVCDLHDHMHTYRNNKVSVHISHSAPTLHAIFGLGA